MSVHASEFIMFSIFFFQFYVKYSEKVVLLTGEVSAPIGGQIVTECVAHVVTPGSVLADRR